MNERTEQYPQRRFARPPGATEILLVRHGASRPASPDAPFPLIEGQGDPELSAAGQAQAERVAERLGDQSIDAVYVSSLRRTQETAAPLCRRLRMSPIVDKDLREVHLGEWEGGLFRIKAHQLDPVFVRMQQEERWDVIPGAESNEALRERLLRAVDRIAARHADQLVVAVVHGGVVGSLLAHAAGARPFAFTGCDNGSISHLVVTEDKLIVRSFNDTAHLYDSIGSEVALPT